MSILESWSEPYTLNDYYKDLAIHARADPPQARDEAGNLHTPFSSFNDITKVTNNISADDGHVEPLSDEQQQLDTATKDAGEASPAVQEEVGGPVVSDSVDTPQQEESHLYPTIQDSVPQPIAKTEPGARVRKDTIRVGTFLIRLSKDEGQLWDVPLILKAEQTSLDRELQDFLTHASLPKRVVCSLCVHGKRKSSARPTVLIWGGDSVSRKQAKKELKEQVLQKDGPYASWRCMSSEFNPLFPRLRPLMDNRLDHMIPAWGVSFSQQSSTKVVSVFNGNTGSKSLIAGNIRILDDDYLFTCAHTFTGVSPLQDLYRQEASHNLEVRFDEEDDTSELTDEEEEEVVGAHSSEDDDDDESDVAHEHASDNKLSDAQINKFARESGLAVRPAGGRAALAGPGAGLERGARSFAWPESAIILKHGATDLDYALIKNPGLDWIDHFFDKRNFWQEDTVPVSKVMIRPHDRSPIEGQLLQSTFGAMRDVQERYWIFWPDDCQQSISRGDSGAWVYDDDYVYGHVIAGDMLTRAAVVVAAHSFYEDVCRHVGPPRLLGVRGSVEANMARVVSGDDELRKEIDRAKLRRSLLALESERLRLDKEKWLFDREKVWNDIERDREKSMRALETERLILDQQKLKVQAEKLSLDQQQVQLDTSMVALERSKTAFEIEKWRLAREMVLWETEKLQLDKLKELASATLEMEKSKIALDHAQHDSQRKSITESRYYGPPPLPYRQGMSSTAPGNVPSPPASLSAYSYRPPSTTYLYRPPSP